MRVSTCALAVLLLCPALPGFSQSADGNGDSGNAPQQNGSVLNVQPGAQAIKPKDRFDNTGYLHPFVRMPRFVLTDQKTNLDQPVSHQQEGLEMVGDFWRRHRWIDCRRSAHLESGAQHANACSFRE